MKQLLLALSLSLSVGCKYALDPSSEPERASDWLTGPNIYLRSLDQNDVSEQTRSNEMLPIQLLKDVVRTLMLLTSFLSKPIPEPSGFKHIDLTL